MEDWKKKIDRMLHPKVKVVLLCIFLTILLEIYVFAFHHQNTVSAYVIYLFSVYTLVISVIGFHRLRIYIRDLIKDDRIWLIAQVRKLLEKNRYTKRYLYEADFRAVVGLYIGLAINTGYAAMKIVYGIVFRSAWFLAIGIYYVVLALIRTVLLKDNYKRSRHADERKGLVHAYKSYRFCGWLLLLMNVTMIGLLIQMIWKNRSYDYPGLAIYASAAFTFYSFIVAIYSMVKFAGNKNPILTAAKNITFAGATMSVLALQTAMISTFGAGDHEFAMLMNSVTGGIVSTFVAGLAVYMIIRGNRALKRIRTE